MASSHCSFPARVRDTLVAPARLFACLRERTPWVDVLLLSTLVAMLAAASQPADLYLEQVENPVTRRGEPVEITSSPAEVVRWGRYLAALSAIAGHPMIALALAGLLTLVFSVLGGGRASFRQHLAVASHALLIPALGTLLLLAGSALLGDPLHADLSPLAPGREPGTLLFQILDGLDLFHLWMLLVVALGVSRLEPRRSFGAAALVLLGAYLALDVLTAWIVVG